MEDKRTEQMEALEVLKDYNPKTVKALEEIVPELRGDSKEDTSEYVDYVFKGVNWELQVVNGTMEVLNEKEELVSKEVINDMVAYINEAYLSKENIKLAQVVEEKLLPFCRRLQECIEKALA